MPDLSEKEKSTLKRLLEHLKPKPLTPEQAEVLATVKYPCC